MATNKHLYTVYHSLDNKGAFDEPDKAQQVDNPLQGKYWFEKTEYPKYVHRKGHESVIVANQDEEAAILSAWVSQEALKASTKVIADKNEADPDVRSALIKKAKELGIKVDGRTSDKKLAYLVEEAEAAA